MKFRLSNVVTILVATSLLLRLLLSSWLLDSWYPYAGEGGAWIQKIHPGTYLALLGVALLASAKGVPTLIQDAWHSQRAALGFLLTVTFAGAITSLIHGMSGLAYLIDTFVAAGCYAIMLGYVRAPQARHIALLVLLVVALNAALALVEYGSGWHALPQPYDYGFMRASAFLGHPLTNGLVTATCMFAAFSLLRSPHARASYAGLLLLSLFAFGARGALLVTICGLAIAILAVPKVAKLGLRDRMVVIPGAVLGLGAVFFVLILVSETQLGASISSRLAADASTDARMASLDVLRTFSVRELMLGVNPVQLESLLELARVPIVENFWVAMLLRLGAPLLALLAVASGVFVHGLVKRAGFFPALTVCVFLVIASTNNSLSSKSVAFVVLTVLLFATKQSAPKPSGGPQ